MTWILLLLVSCVLSCTAVAQQIWKVHNGSLPGAHFTDLPQAVAAAAPNDVIYVYFWSAGGTGSTYTATTIDKPLTIIGFSVLPQGPSGGSPTGVGFYGLFTITGIAAGERVALCSCGIFQETTVWPIPPNGIHVVDCAGEVVLEQVLVASAGFIGTEVRVDNSDNVTLRRCEFRLGGLPVEVNDSELLVSTSSVYHGNPYGYPLQFPGWPIFAQTAPGMRVTNSDVTIINSIVRGSQQVAGYAGYDARPAVHIVSGDVTAGPGAMLRGGAFATSGEAVSYRIDHPTTGRLFKEPRAAVPFSWPAAPPSPITLHAALHNWALAGDIAQFGVWGPVGGFAVMALGNRLTAPLSTPLGELWLDPSAFFVIDLVPLIAVDGFHEWTLPVPVTALVGYPFALQAATLDPSGALALTVPSPFTVQYPYWIAP